MKYILFLGFLMASPLLLPAQYLLRDALALRSCFEPPEPGEPDTRAFLDEGALNDTHRMIFKELLGGAEVTTSNLEAYFADNPFLRVQVTSQSNLEISRAGGHLERPGAAPGFSVAAFADGLARFLVKRTKQELSMAFFDDFKKEIKKQGLLKRFFPYTEAQLQLVDQEIYNFNLYLETLREMFLADIQSLPGNMEVFLREAPDASNHRVVIDLLHLAQQSVDKEPPVEMLHYIAGPDAAIQGADKTGQADLYNLASGMRLLNLLSESLRKPTGSDEPPGWYVSREIKDALHDPVLREIYFGLLWQRAESISFSNDVRLRDALAKLKRDASLWTDWRNSLESFSDNAVALSRSAAGGALAEERVSDHYFRYAQAFAGLLLSVNQTGRAIFGEQKELIRREHVLSLQQCNFLYINLRQKNYTSAISNTIAILNYIGSDKKQIATLLKYANFMAAIAEAQTPEEMQNAIELFALPPGSSRVKKTPGRFALALNAYTGLGGGSEYLENDASPKGVFAVSAPVGLSCSWGLPGRDGAPDRPSNRRDNGSFGFFIPLIDVGAVAAYRFNDANAQDLPELSWNNIISPGLYLVYDTPGKWPVALGFGAQLGPNLRKLDAGGGAELNANGWRFGGFINVDIPITYFHLSGGK